MMKMTYICDCCRIEVDSGKLHSCYRVLRTQTGYKCLPKTWEICENCLQRIQNAMEQEIEKLQSKE